MGSGLFSYTQRGLMAWRQVSGETLPQGEKGFRDHGWREPEGAKRPRVSRRADPAKHALHPFHLVGESRR